MVNRAPSQISHSGRLARLPCKRVTSAIFRPMQVCVLTRRSLIALSNFLDFSEFLENS